MSNPPFWGSLSSTFPVILKGGDDKGREGGDEHKKNHVKLFLLESVPWFSVSLG